MTSASAHIAVVNDDPVQLRLIRSSLESGGFSVSPFLDATEALTTLPHGPPVDLFVVDLHMPGVDGWKLCHLLRSPDFEPYNQVPILVVSATFTGDDVTAITRELGASAFLEVPFDTKRLLSYVNRLLAGEKPRSQPTVLIVEDEDVTRRALAKAFERFGYQVREAATVAEARHQGEHGPADAVLLDYHLPDGSCEPLISELQTPELRTSILIMTGDDDPELPLRLLGSGADGYLRKPFEVEYAVEMVSKARRQRSLLRIESVLETRTRALGASEARYQSLFETIPELVLVIDHDRRVVEANPESLRVLAASPEEVVDAPLTSFIPAEGSPALFSWLDGLRAHEPSRLVTELVRTDGSSIPVELSGGAVEYHDKPACLLVGRDLTERVKVEEERRQLEAQVQRAQRLESLGVLAGGVAHDFNNLLVGILGNASLVMMDLPPDAPERESLQQIEMSAKRAAELTQQILVFAGRSKVESEDVRLSDLVGELGQLIEPAVSKKARLRYDLSAGLPVVQGDAGQIRQVVMNLIINASDALEGRAGNITVKTFLYRIERKTRLDFLGGGRPDPGSYVALSVEDEGCGMTAETLNRIFEPFFTTKSTGRGLGLASTLGIVHAHRGFIAVRSDVGRGSTFTVLLPPHHAQGTGGDEPSRPPSARWEDGGSVLVVDDEPSVRDLASAVLSRHGFTVHEAHDGADGVRRALDPEVGARAVLLDLAMPEMDGLEALELMRRSSPELPVLLSSGYPSDHALARIADDPFTAFIEKPYAPVDLVEAVQALLWGARAAGSLPVRDAAGD